MMYKFFIVVLLVLGSTSDLYSQSVIISDTTSYNAYAYYSKKAKLTINNNFLGFIKLSTGVTKINHGYLFQLVEVQYEDEFEGTIETPTNVVFWKDGSSRVLNSEMVYFDPYFSSFSVINDQLYYWGVPDNFKDNFDFTRDKKRHFAMSYDLETETVDSLHLYQRNYYTDFPFLNKPYEVDDGIAFESIDTLFVLSNKFQIIGTSKPKK